MRKRYGNELSAEEAAALAEVDIDTSEVPDLGKAFWDNARVVKSENRGKRRGPHESLIWAANPNVSHAFLTKLHFTARGTTARRSAGI